MDDRIEAHAEVLVDWSARVEAGDQVVLSVSEGAHDLGVAVAEKLGERGASVHTTYASGELQRAFLRASEGEFPGADHVLALLEATDVYLSLGGGRNTSATADVPGDRRRAYG
jgi:aminopeptidase